MATGDVEGNFYAEVAFFCGAYEGDGGMLESGDAARRNDAAFIEDGLKGESGLAAMFGYEGGPGLSSYFFVLPQTEIEVVNRLKVLEGK